MENFLHFIEYEKRFSKHTLVSYTNDLSQFKIYLLKEYQINHLVEANYHLIRSWILSLAESKISPKTINRKIATLRSYYKFSLREGLIALDPTLKIKAPKLKKMLPCVVTESECEELFE